MSTRVTVDIAPELPGTWSDAAACRPGTGVDPETFHPATKVDSPAWRTQVADAKAICATCDVTRQCLEWAIQVGDYLTVAGGTEPRERRRIAHGLPAQPSSTALRQQQHRTTTIRGLAALGRTDQQIGYQIGLTGEQVERIRRYHRIPAGATVRRLQKEAASCSTT